jgi:hypothetical protein
MSRPSGALYFPRRPGEGSAAEPGLNLVFRPSARIRTEFAPGRKAIERDATAQHRPRWDDAALAQIGEPQPFGE